MELELSQGRVIENVDEQTIVSAIAEIPEDGHAILSGEYFVQAARTPAGFLLEYQDESGQYSSVDEGIPLERIQSVFTSYLQGDMSWTSGLQWTRSGAAAPTSGSPAAGSQIADSPAVDNPLDDIAGTVKKAATRFVKGKLKRLFG